MFSFLGGCDNEANRCDGYAAELSAATGKDCAYGNSTPAKRQKYFYEASTFYSLVAPPMLPQIRNCLQNVQDMEGVSLAQKSTLGELLSSVSQNPELILSTWDCIPPLRHDVGEFLYIAHKTCMDVEMTIRKAIPVRFSCECCFLLLYVCALTLVFFLCCADLFT